VRVRSPDAGQCTNGRPRSVKIIRGGKARAALGVDYNTHAIDSILAYVAPALGWR